MSKEAAERIFNLFGIVMLGLVCPIFVPLADELFSASNASDHYRAINAGDGMTFDIDPEEAKKAN